MLYNEDPRQLRMRTRVEAGSNTSTVTLRVVGGDEKGSLESETVKYGRESHPRKTALARASSIYKRQTRPLVRQGAPQKQDRDCQRALDTKTYWLWLDFDWEWELSESLVTAVEDELGDMTTSWGLKSQPVKRRLNVWFEDFVCAVVTVRLLYSLC
jgi:hypothetical protein